MAHNGVENGGSISRGALRQDLLSTKFYNICQERNRACTDRQYKHILFIFVLLKTYFARNSCVVSEIRLVGAHL